MKIVLKSLIDPISIGLYHFEGTLKRFIAGNSNFEGTLRRFIAGNSNLKKHFR